MIRHQAKRKDTKAEGATKITKNLDALEAEFLIFENWPTG